MATQQEVIKAFMASLDTTTLKETAAVDEAIKSCSNFGGTQAVINKIISDCKSYISADSKNGWKNFLSQKCGINLDNTDTGAITGSDAGGKTAKTAESIVPESGSLKNFSGQSFTVNGLTFKLEKNFSNLSAKEKFIWQGLYTWWAKGALDLLKTSYGYSFNDSDVYFKEITVKFVDDSATPWLAWNHSNDFNNDGKVDKVTLNINMYDYKNIDTTNSNGYSSSYGVFYLDRTLAHEFTHTIMYAKILNSMSLSSTVREGLGELTHGIDDERKTAITYLARNLGVLEKNLKGTSSTYNYAAGYIFFRYLVKQAAVSKSILGTNGNNSFNNSTSGATIKALGGNDWIYNTGTKNKIYTSAGVDSIFNHAATVTIDGGDGADYIYNASVAANTSIIAGAGKDSIFNHGQKVTINGGNDADYINNFKGNVTIYGGAGADSIYGNEGSNIRIDAGSGNDLISNFSSNVTIFGGAGNDSVYGIEGKNITVDAGAGNDYILNRSSNISVFGGADSDSIFNDALSSSATIDGGNGNDSISNRGSKVLIRGGANNDTITNYGSNVTLDGGNGNDYMINLGAASSMVGGANNDSILGYTGNDTLKGDAGDDKLFGNAGNDLIYGGAGNDSLWGNAGKDTFVYASGDGKDIIYGFENNDMLKITGTFSTSYNKSKKEIYFKVASTSNAITLKNFTATSFNVNGTAYKISGSKLIKK